VKATPVAAANGSVAAVITTAAEGEDWVVANSSLQQDMVILHRAIRHRE
jgi:hypothetical protein